MDGTASNQDGTNVNKPPVDNGNPPGLEGLEAALARCTCPPLQLSVIQRPTHPSPATGVQPEETYMVWGTITAHHGEVIHPDAFRNFTGGFVDFFMVGFDLMKGIRMGIDHAAVDGDHASIITIDDAAEDETYVGVPDATPGNEGKMIWFINGVRVDEITLSPDDYAID